MPARANSSLFLDQARQRTPPQTSIGGWMANLRAAFFDGIKESDIVAIAEKMKDKALAGDVAAQKLLLAYVIGAPGAAARDVVVVDDELAEKPKPPRLPAPEPRSTISFSSGD